MSTAVGSAWCGGRSSKEGYEERKREKHICTSKINGCSNEGHGEREV